MKKDNRGSFTVEAAFAVPVFIFGIMTFMYLFQILLMQIQLQGAMAEASKDLSKLAYIQSDKEESANTIGGSLAVKTEVNKYFSAKDRYKSFCKNAISYSESKCPGEDGKIDLVADYKVQIPTPIFRLKALPFAQRIKTRGFIGTDELLYCGNRENSGEDNDYVYITETGTVYHETMECSSLNLKISECAIEEVTQKRNTAGGKYKRCEKCCKDLRDTARVYICEDGDRFHIDLECSGLKRTIRRVRLAEVKENMRACYRCGARES